MTVNPIASTVGNTSSVASAIAFASQKTGIDFNYLLGQAQVESGLNANARAGTSSASGLYQFIEQSWLSVVKKHGADHGLGWAAQSIQPGANGRLTVSDPATRQAILRLRNDATTASLMAAEHAADNKASIEGSLGRPATGTDLYMAHFLGLGGARQFLRSLDANPDKIGAALFPAAARANRAIFYAPNGQPRTVSEIYDRFAAKLDSGAAAGGATGLASATLGAPAAADPLEGAEIIPGAGESLNGATRWAKATINRLGDSDGAAGTQLASQFNTLENRTAQLLRPTPDTARIAYLLLARLGA